MPTISAKEWPNSYHLQICEEKAGYSEGDIHSQKNTPDNNQEESDPSLVVEKPLNEQKTIARQDPLSLNLETAVQDGEVMQDFELEPLTAGGDHSQKVKALPAVSGYGSEDCVNLPSSTAVSRLTPEGMQLLAHSLNEEMVTNASLDQTKLLSGVSFSELLAIRCCYSHPLMEEIVGCVWKGEWESLIELTRQDPHLPIFDILKAAFCQGKLGAKDPSHEGIDNLASAYIFLGPAMAGQPYKIYHFNDVVQHPEIWGDISKRWDNCKGIPERQQYFILVEAKAYHPETEILMKALHEQGQRNEVAGGIRFYHDKGWALGSAGLIRNDHLLQGCTPIYGRCLRSIKERFCHLSQHLVDMALHEPSDKQTLLHGVPKQGNALTTHDGYHAVRIATKTLKYPELLLSGERLYDLLFTKAIPWYSKYVKSRAFSTTFYEMLIVEPRNEGTPTYEDWIRFLVYETVIAIQDGEAYYFAKSANEMIKGTLKMIYNRHRMMYKECGAATPPLYIKLMPFLNQYLNPIGIAF